MDEWVQIIHPETGGVGTVSVSSLYQWYAAGWRPLAEGDIPPPEPPPEPEPMTRAQAAAAAQTAAAESEEN